MKERMERFAGRGFRTRMDPDFVYTAAPLGEYRFVLSVNGQQFTKSTSILQDHWYNN